LNVTQSQRTGRGERDSNAKVITLKELTRILDLSPTTISLVLNRARGAKSIPKETKDRIFEAVRKYNYRPNFLARSLRVRRTFSVGVLVPELSDGYSAQVLAGIEQRLLDAGYLCLVTTHHHRPELLEDRPLLLYERCVDGIIAVDTPVRGQPPTPVVSVSGHHRVPGVLNIELDHGQAARLALEHLLRLGHREIAVIQGQAFSSDTEVRWESIQKTAAELGVEIPPERVVQLEGDSPLPDTGYEAAKRLLARGASFTALFSFNDISAFGAIRALREAGLRVPEDVSVVGFDDIWEASYHIPPLTTIRQPLEEMGRLAASMLLERIQGPRNGEDGGVVLVQPELVVRASTAPAPDKGDAGRQ